MKRLIPCCVAVIILAGCAKDQKEPAAAADSAASAQPKPSYYEEQKQTLTATVEAIDPSTRTVSLRGDAGKTLTFKANDEVRNLDQVKVGDRVAVDYLESVSIHVQPPGEAINDVRSAADRAEPGQKPGGMTAQHTTMTAIVQKIDKKAGTATLKGPQGNVRTVKARDPRNLEKVNVGDRVVITYTEMLAIEVRPAPSATP